MTFSETAQALVDGCRAGKERENLDKLYAPDAVSVEAVDYGTGRTVAGLDGIKAKHDWFETAMEVLSQKVTGPLPHAEDAFAVIFDVNMKDRASGEVTENTEVAIYHVSDGKITREEFFYG